MYDTTSAELRLCSIRSIKEDLIGFASSASMFDGVMVAEGSRICVMINFICSCRRPGRIDK